MVRVQHCCCYWLDLCTIYHQLHSCMSLCGTCFLQTCPSTCGAPRMRPWRATGSPELSKHRTIQFSLSVTLLSFCPAAMIIKTWGTTQEAAEGYWKHRWAIYVIKAERRLPRAWVQRLRLGQLTYDPVSDKRVHR